MTEPGEGTNRYAYALNNPVNLRDPGGNDITSALSLIAEHRNDIHEAADKYDVDPKGIASIIFNEKLWTFWAERKNDLAYVLDGGVSDDTSNRRSYGLTEMQLGLVMELSGIDPDSEGANEQAYALITDPKSAIDLAAKNIARN